MANRSLRRTYNPNDGIVQPDSSADGSAENSERESTVGNAHTDSVINGDGEVTVRESDSVSGGIGVVEIDPANLADYIASDRAANTGSGSGRTRRPRSDAGKPRGIRARKTAEIPTLVTIHNLINSWACFLHAGFKLDDEEKKKMDAALENFAQYHELPLLSPKRASELELLNALAVCYGPRFYIMLQQAKQDARLKQAKKVNPFVVNPQVNQNEAVQ